MIFVRCLTWKVATVKRFLHLPSQLDLYLDAPIQLLNRDQKFFSSTCSNRSASRLHPCQLFCSGRVKKTS